MELYGFQREVLDESKHFNRVAYYYDMGLGKTFIGSEKAVSLGCNILVVCQKSKVDDWKIHFAGYYYSSNVCDLTKIKNDELDGFFQRCLVDDTYKRNVWIINYDLLFRRPQLARLKNYTLVLDESSLIQNESSKRTRFIMKKLKPSNVVLLSGTPTGGKYEKLWSQLRLLGLNMTKREYWDRYVNYYVDTRMGFPLTIVNGYKNVTELKRVMHDLGCFFKKTHEVFNLPAQTFVKVHVAKPKGYDKFQKTGVLGEWVGDTPLTKLLYSRMICGQEKINAFVDLVESTEDRLIVFYNFDNELRQLVEAVKHKKVSIVNGSTKDLTHYENCEDSITFIQYQAGAMGLNLQKANKIIYFTPPLSSELYEQSKKRIHRIGQKSHCTYYNLICVGTVEVDIYNTLALRRDYTDKLFVGGR